MGLSGSRTASAGAMLLAVAVIMLCAVGCGQSRPEPTPTTVIGVGPVQAPPPRPLTDLIDDPDLVSVVAGQIRHVDPVRWHRDSIVYPYSLVHVTVDREWKQPQAKDLAVRIFGGVEGDRKYVSAIQPDPVTLGLSTHVLLFVSPVAEIDPGVRASTVEEFFFIEGDQLLRFDRTPAGITVTDAFKALDRKGGATPSPS
jgi:hypothetical protein